MKRIACVFTISAMTFFCLIACGKKEYYNYIVEGRVIDKTTKEPIENMLVSFFKYDDLLSSENKTQKTSPPDYDAESDANGIFITYQKYSCSSIYIYGDYNGLYPDTVIPVDFSTAIFAGVGYKRYRGNYILYLGDIELEKIDKIE